MTATATGKAIHGRLSGNTTADTRIYPLTLPQNATYPAVTYQQISVRKNHAYGTDARVIAVRMQVDSWADTYTAARTLADEVATTLSRFSGPINGVVVRDILLDTERELYEDGIRRVWQDYIVYIEA